MKEFTIYTLETAPDEAKAVLQIAKNTFGFIPNLLGIMSNSPALAEAYLSISGIFDNRSTCRIFKTTRTSPYRKIARDSFKTTS